MKLLTSKPVLMLAKVVCESMSRCPWTSLNSLPTFAKSLTEPKPLTHSPLDAMIEPFLIQKGKTIL